MSIPLPLCAFRTLSVAAAPAGMFPSPTHERANPPPFARPVAFVTFLRRAVFLTLNAPANAPQNDGAACTSSCGIPCNNMYTLIQN